MCVLCCALCILHQRAKGRAFSNINPVLSYKAVICCCFVFFSVSSSMFFLCVSIFLCFACVTVTAASGCNGKWELSCTEKKKKKSRTEGLYNISQFSLPRINEQKCLLDFKNRRKSVLITVYDL